MIHEPGFFGLLLSLSLSLSLPLSSVSEIALALCSQSCLLNYGDVFCVVLAIIAFVCYAVCVSDIRNSLRWFFGISCLFFHLTSDNLSELVCQFHFGREIFAQFFFSFANLCARSNDVDAYRDLSWVMMIQMEQDPVSVHCHFRTFVLCYEQMKKNQYIIPLYAAIPIVFVHCARGQNESQFDICVKYTNGRSHHLRWSSLATGNKQTQN